MSGREWFVLGSYFLLLGIFILGVVVISFAPSLAPAFAVWMGLIFVVMGAHLIHFRKTHASIWENWGGPSQGAFIMVGLFFLGIGVFFAVNAF